MQRLPWKSGRHSSANSHTPQAKTTPNVSLTASSRGEPETQDLITNIEPHGPAVHATLEADHPPPITSPPLQPVVPATHLPPPQIITNAVELSGLPGRLWTQAYDAIWTDEPELAKSYEAILRGELGDESSLANNEEGNHRTDATQAQMERLVKVGLERTKREAAVKHKIHEGMRVVSSVKDLVGTALKQAPEAAPAWAGICLLLQVSGPDAAQTSSDSSRYLKTLPLRRVHIVTECPTLSRGWTGTGTYRPSFWRINQWPTGYEQH